MDIAAFWELSPRETADCIIAKNERLKAREKARWQEMCVIAYCTAELTAIGIGAPKKFPENAKEAFPGAFDLPEGKGISVSDWQRGKEHMEEYARYSKGRVMK